MLTRVVWSSHTDAWFGSSQANRSVHSPLAAVSRSTLIISLRLASRASLSSPFSSPCYIGSYCSAFRSSCLLTSLVQQWFTLTNMQYGNIVSRTNGAGWRYTESRTYRTYISRILQPTRQCGAHSRSPQLGECRTLWGERKQAMHYSIDCYVYIYS